MNLGTILTQARSLLLEPSTVTPPSTSNDGQWLDLTELVPWAQEANDDLTECAEMEAAATTIATVRSTESYALPADFGRLRRVELQDLLASTLWYPLNNASIDMRLPNMIAGALIGIGRPHSYFLWNGQIRLIPIPDAVYTLNVFYYLIGNALAVSADTPIIPPRFHHLIREYVVAKAKQKVDDPGYVVNQQAYDLGKIKMIGYLDDERHTEGPRVPREI